LRLALLSLAAVASVAVAVIAVAHLWFGRSVEADVRRLAAAAQPVPVVDPAKIAGLPPTVQRYLAWSGVVGKPIPSTVRLTQRGRIRSSAEAGWMAFEAVEVYSTRPPGFVWRAFFRRRSMPVVFGRDEYLDGQGSIVMKMLGLYPVADARGDELGPAGLTRYLNEAMWFPAAYLGDNVTWEAIDDRSARVTISDRGMTASGIFFFDAAGRPVNFRAPRYNTATGKVETWETPLTAYGQLAGANVPTGGTGVWKLADGDLAYIELEVTDIAYDEPFGR
jgi:hypothetical protein